MSSSADDGGVRRFADVIGDVRDLPLEDTGPPAVVLAGRPTTSCRVLFEDAALEVGVWEVTPGEFASRKHGLSETMHFVAGAGRLEHPDGSATEIAPGTVVHLHDGWEGVWRVTATTRKSYVIVHTPATRPGDGP